MRVHFGGILCNHDCGLVVSGNEYGAFADLPPYVQQEVHSRSTAIERPDKGAPAIARPERRSISVFVRPIDGNAHPPQAANHFEPAMVVETQDESGSSNVG